MDFGLFCIWRAIFALFVETSPVFAGVSVGTIKKLLLLNPGYVSLSVC